jgi:cytochrome c
MKLIPVALALGCLVGASASHAEVDEVAAQALLRSSQCLKCHSVDKKKDGPPFKQVAASYQGDPEAEDKLMHHLKDSPIIEIDGYEEEHKPINSKDDAAILNVVRFILSR